MNSLRWFMVENHGREAKFRRNQGEQIGDCIENEKKGRVGKMSNNLQSREDNAGTVRNLPGFAFAPTERITFEATWVERKVNVVQHFLVRHRLVRAVRHSIVVCEQVHFPRVEQV